MVNPYPQERNDGYTGDDLNIVGKFKTLSPGKHPETANCFCYPLDDGAWKVFRFNPGTAEADTWHQNGKDWTWCYFNRLVQEKKVTTIKVITCQELATNNYDFDWLVPNVVAKGLPLVAGGGQKECKTSTMLDFAVSGSTGTDFLGRFPVTTPFRVVMLSGESGLPTLKETAERISRSKGLSLADNTNLLFSTFLPQATNRTHIEALEEMIKETGCEFLILDPWYLCAPGADAGNLFSQGERLRNFSEPCERLGVTLALVHHTRKRSKGDTSYEPAELHDLSWAGISEFARQWFLFSRREAFEPGTGEHKLWLTIGGSLGHSSRWGLDISEGPSGSPRKWEVELKSPSDARREKKGDSIRDRLLEAAKQYPAGETKTTLIKTARLRWGEDTGLVFQSLIDGGQLGRSCGTTSTLAGRSMGRFPPNYKTWRFSAT